MAAFAASLSGVNTVEVIWVAINPSLAPKALSKGATSASNKSLAKKKIQKTIKQKREECAKHGVEVPINN